MCAATNCHGRGTGPACSYYNSLLSTNGTNGSGSTNNYLQQATGSTNTT
jgi:hypothetical protein